MFKFYRGLFAGGYISGYSNVIEYITISSTGNAQDFGDLIAAKVFGVASSSSIRGVFGSGNAPGIVNVIEYVTISSTGNSIDFGDLSVAKVGMGACSNGHGGL